MRTKRRPTHGRLLARDFAAEINDPASSSLSDDQLLVLHVAIELEDMFGCKQLPPAKRALLRRLHGEISAKATASLSRRFARAVAEVEHRLGVLERRRGKRVTSSDALALVMSLEALGFDVHDYWAPLIEDCIAILREWRPRSMKRGVSSAGVVARILFPARAGEPGKSLNAFAKKIGEAARRERL